MKNHFPFSQARKIFLVRYTSKKKTLRLSSNCVAFCDKCRIIHVFQRLWNNRVASNNGAIDQKIRQKQIRATQKQDLKETLC